MRILGVVTVALLLAPACASSTQLERDAQVHQLRAQRAMERNDFDRAENERMEAARLHEKAVRRAYKEGNAGNVTFQSNPY